MKYIWCNVLSVVSILAEISPHSQDTCDAESDVKCEGNVVTRTDCDRKIELQNIEDVSLGEDNIFFIESSPKELLSSRESCALESAARNSGLRVVMVRVGRMLDLRDNTTCQIYSRFKDSVSLYHIDLDTFSIDTKLENFFKGSILASSSHRYVHTADALRLLLINKYGGFYADSDFVILKSLKSLKNVIASDQVSDGDVFTKKGHLLVGDCVTNAIFHFSKSAPILDSALEIFSRMYDPRGWATGGPDVLQRALLTQCGLDPGHKLRFSMTRERFSPDQCGGVSLLDYKSFFPIGWMNQVMLYEPKRRKSEWMELFKQSYGVHFYHSSSQKSGPLQVVKNPKYYGARRPAYLSLALDHCPVSYWSKDNMF